MTEPLDDDQIETYLALLEIVGQLRFRLESHLRDRSTLTFVQFEILGRLMRTPGGRLRMTDLADELAASRSGLTYQVRSLARDGLVERLPSVDDERTTLVALTDAGRRTFASLLPGHMEIASSLLFDAMSPNQARTFGRLARTVRRHIRALPPRSAQPRATGGGTALGG